MNVKIYGILNEHLRLSVQGSKGKASPIPSSKMENEYQKNPRGSFQFPIDSHTYEISFKGLFKTNTCLLNKLLLSSFHFLNRSGHIHVFICFQECIRKMYLQTIRDGLGGDLNMNRLKLECEFSLIYCTFYFYFDPKT